MGEAGGMVIWIGIMAVLLIGGFLIFWLRDAKRSEKVADNPERLEQDPGGNDNPVDRR